MSNQAYYLRKIHRNRPLSSHYMYNRTGETIMQDVDCNYYALLAPMHNQICCRLHVNVNSLEIQAGVMYHMSVSSWLMSINDASCMYTSINHGAPRDPPRIPILVSQTSPTLGYACHSSALGHHEGYPQSALVVQP